MFTIAHAASPRRRAGSWPLLAIALLCAHARRAQAVRAHPRQRLKSRATAAPRGSASAMAVPACGSDASNACACACSSRAGQANESSSARLAAVSAPRVSRALLHDARARMRTGRCPAVRQTSSSCSQTVRTTAVHAAPPRQSTITRTRATVRVRRVDMRRSVVRLQTWVGATGPALARRHVARACEFGASEGMSQGLAPSVGEWP